MAEDTKKKVLVVDDDASLLTVLVDKLSASGFETENAKNGKEGLEKALSFHPDIILLDVMMPEMNGWDMLEELRKDTWGSTAKVVMLTVFENLDHVAKGVEKNIHGYLVKTNWSLDDVVGYVREALKV